VAGESIFVTGSSKIFSWATRSGAREYCVDTVALDEECTRKYVKYQEKEERRQESL